jgi:two-component system, NtrC family, sensor kinase
MSPTGTARSRPRTVASRILLSYSVVLLVFVLASVWSVTTFRAAAEDAALMRQGYMPLALEARDLVAAQDTWNSQLNHITEARNPADKRVWFERTLAIGRPRTLADFEQAIERALPPRELAVDASRRELFAELAQVRHLMGTDGELVAQLFEKLERGDQTAAQRLRDRLVERGIAISQKLVRIERRVKADVDLLLYEAKAREQLALLLSLLVGGVTLLTGLFMAIYARRVVTPLTLVTKRAAAVASGDLRPDSPLETGDEIGELSITFEAMVGAIAEARERLLASERLATIGKMAAHVTHEVRNPLSSIALNLDLLEEELPADGREARNLLRAISLEVQRLSVLSDQYLSMARRKAPELEDADPAEMVHSAASFMKRDLEKNQVELIVEVQTDLPWVQADVAQVRQVLFNLLRNAREAVLGGGRVRLRATAADGGIVISVEDDGPGVPAERVEEMFDPFFTTKDHGTGLGLAVTRQIVQAHGGRLEYRTRAEGGAHFEFWLPASADSDSGASRVETEGT